MKAKFYINLTTEPIVESAALLSLNSADDAATLIGTVAFGKVSKGEKGDKGDKGDVGSRGEQGVQGERGARGEQGIQGVQGVKGDAGAKGDKGEQGVKGDTGIQGEQGVKGDAFEYSDFTAEQLDALKVKGDTGDRGDTGTTAFESAVAGGFTGTEEQFNASIASIGSIDAVLNTINRKAQ